MSGSSFNIGLYLAVEELETKVVSVAQKCDYKNLEY